MQKRGEERKKWAMLGSQRAQRDKCQQEAGSSQVEDLFLLAVQPDPCKGGPKFPLCRSGSTLGPSAGVGA